MIFGSRTNRFVDGLAVCGVILRIGTGITLSLSVLSNGCRKRLRRHGHEQSKQDRAHQREIDANALPIPVFGVISPKPTVVEVISEK